MKLNRLLVFLLCSKSMKLLHVLGTRRLLRARCAGAGYRRSASSATNGFDIFMACREVSRYREAAKLWKQFLSSSSLLLLLPINSED